MTKNQPNDPTKEKDRLYRAFLWKNITNGLIWLGLILLVYFIAARTLPKEWGTYLQDYTDRPFWMFSIFFFSETFTGLIPLELFVIWARQDPVSKYILYVFMLSVLSFIGGIIAYYIGTKVNDLPFLKKLTERPFIAKNSDLYRRFGGIVIVLAALTPLPYAIICFVSGAFEYPFRRFLLYATTRFLRFAIIGWILWSIRVA